MLALIIEAVTGPLGAGIAAFTAIVLGFFAVKNGRKIGKLQDKVVAMQEDKVNTLQDTQVATAKENTRVSNAAQARANSDHVNAAADADKLRQTDGYRRD